MDTCLIQTLVIMDSFLRPALYIFLKINPLNKDTLQYEHFFPMVSNLITGFDCTNVSVPPSLPLAKNDDDTPQISEVDIVLIISFAGCKLTVRWGNLFSRKLSC